MYTHRPKDANHLRETMEHYKDLVQGSKRLQSSKRNYGTLSKISSKGGEVLYGHPTIERIGISFPFDRRSPTLLRITSIRNKSWDIFVAGALYSLSVPVFDLVSHRVGVLYFNDLELFFGPIVSVSFFKGRLRFSDSNSITDSKF